MDRAVVLRVVTSPTEVPAAPRAEALILGEHRELAPAAVAAAKTEGALHSSSQASGSAEAALAA
jgi:hypothetical protein